MNRGMSAGSDDDTALRLGLEAMRAARFDQAEQAFLQVAGANPKDHRAWHMLAVIALNTARPAKAVELAQRALQHDRRNAAYLSTLGVAAAECGEFEEAIKHFRRALREHPSFVDASYNLGKTLVKIGDLAGARDAYRRTLAFNPRQQEARKNLAWVLRELGELDTAIALLDEARADSPDDEQVLLQLANAHRERSGSAAGLDFYRTALSRLPASRALHGGLARLLLARGEWREGWRAYLGRDTVPQGGPLAPVLARDLSGMRIRLVGEQGLGDVLFFLRFAPELAARGARVALECQPKLVGLLKGLPLFDDVIAYSDPEVPEPGNETRVDVGDLPALLEVTSTPPAVQLVRDPQRVQRCRELLTRHGEPPYIGLTWRGGTAAREPEFGRRLDALSKEIPLDCMAEALAGVRGTLVVLQRNPRAEEIAWLATRLGRPLHDRSALNDDLEEMAALLAVLDEYVAVSNTNVHLAAGVGRSAKVLVPYPPEWRWLESSDESPWFPGCPVYRQSPLRSWTAAASQLNADLTRA